MPNRFVVDLGDMKLDDSAKRRIANAIQVAALGELARLDAATSAEPFAVYDPVKLRNPEWYGIWIKLLRGRDALPTLEKELEQIKQFSAGP